MTEDHDRIDELLAGHAMHSLDGEDAREAELLLTEHVPGCQRCRETVAEFQDLVGELALAASPVEPPELLLARLRADMRPPEMPVAADPQRIPPQRSIAMWAAVAAAVAVFGLGAWNAVLNQRIGHVQSTQRNVANAVSFLNEPGSKVVDLTDARFTSSRVVMGYRPRETHVVLFGTDIPTPAAGHEYRLWLGQSGTFKLIRAFLPEDGIVVLGLTFDASRYDQILITEEPVEADTSAPRGTHRWSATLTPEP
jgi:hypothetical protein